MAHKESYLAVFNRCIGGYDREVIKEYISPRGNNALEAAPAPGADPMGGDPMGGGAPMQPADPMGGGAPASGADPMGGDPMSGGAPASGADPMGGGAPAPGADPMGGGAPGFNPQGVDDAAGEAPMDAEAPEGEDAPGPDDNVVKIDDLTDSQKATEEKLDKMMGIFQDITSKIEKFAADNEARARQKDEEIASLRAEIEKRNPTPDEKLSIRSTKSTPYGETPSEYWDKVEADPNMNYSSADDNNGADMPEYKITKSDVDAIADWRNIAKEIEGGNVPKMSNIRDILGY